MSDEKNEHRAKIYCVRGHGIGRFDAARRGVEAGARRARRGVLGARPAHGREKHVLLAYDKTTEKVDAFTLGGSAPYLHRAHDDITLKGGPYDLFDTFVLGNETYLLAYRADNGTFAFFRVLPNLTVSPPYTFTKPRVTPTHGFTTIGAFSSLGLQYVMAYDFENGTVGAFSVAVTNTSTGGVPPLLVQNVWYHQWAKGWTRFAFFQLGGSNFFFKTNTAKLNVNIDHLQDDPSKGSVEVGSWLQNQLPDALAIDVVKYVPWANGEPYFLTYIAASGKTTVNRIHADCLGWTQTAEATTMTGATLAATYRIGGDSFVLLYTPA